MLLLLYKFKKLKKMSVFVFFWDLVTYFDIFRRCRREVTFRTLTDTFPDTTYTTLSAGSTQCAFLDIERRRPLAVVKYSFPLAMSYPLIEERNSFLVPEKISELALCLSSSQLLFERIVERNTLHQGYWFLDWHLF